MTSTSIQQHCQKNMSNAALSVLHRTQSQYAERSTGDGVKQFNHSFAKRGLYVSLVVSHR
jgi:hypothetical protein